MQGWASRIFRREGTRDPLEGVGLLLPISRGDLEVQESWVPLWVETIHEDRWGNAVTFARQLRPARPNAT